MITTLEYQAAQKINYWNNTPKMHGLVRQSYLATLQKYQTSDLIKVLIGQKRCGKSTILKHYITHLLHQDISPKISCF